MAMKLTMNGREVTAEPGQTLLEVAEEHGVWIPTLCASEAVRPYGACRLCLVEVTKGKKTRIVTSCVYLAAEGISVRTDTEEIVSTRRMLMELELASSPGSEALRSLAVRLGVDLENPRLAPDDLSPDEPGHDCILCGLCVRVCREVVGVNAIGFANRGPQRLVVSPFQDKASLCIGCGSCVYVCPTNCIRMEEQKGVRIIHNWKAKFKLIACKECGNHFATDKEIAHLIESCGMPEQKTRICHSCRT